MRGSYLEVTYRRGRPFAAYYHLPRKVGDQSASSKRIDPGMVIDYTVDGRAIGIEITAPSTLALSDLNRVLQDLGFPNATNADLAPLSAA